MIANLKPYSAMKDSGVPWLGEVPEHWEVRKLKHVTRFHNGIAFKPSDWAQSGIPIIRIQNLNGSNLFNYTKRSDLSDFLRIRPGDLLFSWSGNRGTSFGPFIWNREFDGYLNQHIFKLDGYTLERTYFAHLLRAVTLHIEERSHGIIGLVHVTKPELGAVLVPVASSNEQHAIARFLEHADRQIRRYIRAKQRLIKLLEEQKQAIVYRAVTRGLDPNVRLKPSGVEWLGDVPEHWEVKLLHHLLDPAIPLAYGILLPGPRLDEGVSYLGAGDVRPDRLRLDALPRTRPEIASAYPRTRMRAGELVYAIRGSFGNVEVIPPALEGVNLSRDAARLAPRSDVNAFWLAFLLRSRICQDQFKFKEIGATIKGVNIRDLKRVALPVPPRDEQSEIVRLLEAETSVTNDLMRRANREISLLREYGTRLIADVVTGKLDVREAAERLLNDGEVPEPLDGTDALTDAEGATADDSNAAPEEVEA